jgi:hypothetical protein
VNVSRKLVDIPYIIADDNFRAVVYQKIGKTAPAPIFDTDVITIDTLIMRNMGIKSLKGVEYFISLVHLDISNDETSRNAVEKNVVTELNIAENILLKYLDVGGNKIETLFLEKNIALEYIDASDNDVKNVNLPESNTLETLLLSGNKIETIDLSKTIELKILDLSNNEIKGLDLSENTKLESLFLENNFIASQEDVKGLEKTLIDIEKFVLGDQTSIRKVAKSDKKYGIKFAKNPVADKAEISVILPNNETSTTSTGSVTSVTVAIYDNTGNVVFVGATALGRPLIWNLTNNAGRNVANGSYLVIAEVKSASGKVYQYSAKLGVKR